MVTGGGQVERTGRTRSVAGCSLSEWWGIIRMLVQILTVDDGGSRIFSMRKAGLVAFDVHSETVLFLGFNQQWGFDKEREREKRKKRIRDRVRQASFRPTGWPFFLIAAHRPLCNVRFASVQCKGRECRNCHAYCHTRRRTPYESDCLRCLIGENGNEPV